VNPNSKIPALMDYSEQTHEKLADADILLVQGQPPDADYRFKHALIQDAAYENLLKSRRQVLHRRIADALLDHASTAGAEPELLAHHFTQAGEIETAIEWWGKANARRWLKQPSSSRVRLTTLRPCPPCPRFVAKRSSFRLG
jgi:predicted ATPase